MSSRKPCITELYPNLDIEKVRQALGTEALKALAGLHFIGGLCRGHRQYDDVSKFTKRQIDDVLRKVKIYDRQTIEAAKLVAQGVASLPEN